MLGFCRVVKEGCTGVGEGFNLPLQNEERVMWRVPLPGKSKPSSDVVFGKSGIRVYPLHGEFKPEY